MKKDDDLIENLEYLINRTYEVEKEFIELKNILNGVIEFLPQAIWVIDKDNNIIAQNSKAKDLGLLNFDDDEEIKIDDRFYLIKKSFLDDKMIITATDITTKKRDERLISMGQMAAHLAHEIRNPIGSISILISMLMKKNDKKLNSVLMEMKKAVFRVERIIKSTLLFSKGVKLNKKNFYVSEFENDLKEAVKYYTYSKDIEFVYFLPDIEIKADYDLLLLVLQNMIFNGIDAIEEDDEEEGIIEVLFDIDERYFYFRIYDSGRDFENKDILFEAFKTTKTKGNGLGLSLSLQIIKAHNGEINFTDKKKGFEIKIPK